eukprot:147736_1
MQPCTGWEMYELELKQPLLQAGDPLIDNLLDGGLRKGITEISGEAGSGKSSFGMQLLFQCCLRIRDGGLNAKAVYISTEGAVHHGRYNQLHEYYSQKYSNIDFGSRILMMDVQAESVQQKSLFDLLPKQAELNNVKLIVLDSIATFYRTKTNYIQRAKEMNKTCHHLTKLSHQHNMIVVLINQVTDVFPSDSLFIDSVLSLNRKVKPSLGLAWTNIIDTRIMLAKHIASRDIRCVDKESNETYFKGSTSQVMRQLHVIFSPYLEKQWINFEINDRGIQGVQLVQVQQQTQTESMNKIHDVFDGITDSQLQDIFNSDSQNTWTQTANSMNHNNENNTASSCSPTQKMTDLSSGTVADDEDDDIEILYD